MMNKISFVGGINNHDERFFSIETKNKKKGLFKKNERKQQVKSSE